MSERNTAVDRSRERARMVAQHLQARGIADERVLAALREVPREAFVDPSLAESAYADAPLPIGLGQTISQPFVVAAMVEALRVGDHEANRAQERRDARGGAARRGLVRAVDRPGAGNTGRLTPEAAPERAAPVAVPVKVSAKADLLPRSVIIYRVGLTDYPNPTYP